MTNIKVYLFDLPSDGRRALMLEASGHAGAAAPGQDIVCAAVSSVLQLMMLHLEARQQKGDIQECFWDMHPGRLQLYAIERIPCCGCGQKRTKHGGCKCAAEDGVLQQFTSTVCRMLQDIARQYPQNVQLQTNCMAPCEPLAVNTQLFAGEGAGGAAAAPGGENSAGENGANGKSGGRQAAAEADGDAEAAAARSTEQLAPPKAEAAPQSGPGTQEAQQPVQPPKEDAQPAAPGADAAARRKAFGRLMQGEYQAEFAEMMQLAIQTAAQNLAAGSGMDQLMEALQQRYGDTSDLAALAAAVREGPKDDAYYQRLAEQKGINVATARELDRLQSENRALTARQREAERTAQVQRIRAAWDAEAARLAQKYPGFDYAAARADPAFADLMRRGVGLEAAYRAVYFDQLVEQSTAAAARAVEQGVAERIRQRNARPGENGAHPGGAAQLKTSVASMTRAQREEIERQVLHGAHITF